MKKLFSLMRRFTHLLGIPEIRRGRLKKFKAACVETIPSRPEPDSLCIVVPCYSHASFLEPMFSSILAQSNAPDEVVFVVDASPDESYHILNTLIQKHQAAFAGKFILLNNQTNIGQAASINKAVEAAVSSLIMILNDDDYLMHDVVSIIKGIFSHNKNIFMIGGHCVLLKSESQLVAASKISGFDGNFNQLPLLLSSPEATKNYCNYNDINITHSGSTFFKGAWRYCGGYYSDKKRRVVPFSDRDFQLRLNSIFPLGIVPKDYPLSFWRDYTSVDSGIDS